MAKIIGIDVGTTNSVVAVMEGGKPKVIHTAEGENLIPSVVDPLKNLVGRVAKRQQIVNPKNTIFSIKRIMGKRYLDPDIQYDMKWLPYDIKEGSNGMAVVEVEGKTFTPQEISAKIIQKAKNDAESYLGEKVEKAVITVPAYFDDSQRQATKQAGEIAGLEVVRIINEPTAATLAYGLEKNKDEQIAVYDLGGGTFDISILEIEAKGEEERGVYQVLSTAGDTHLGGDDFDQKIIDFFIEEFKKEQGINIREDRQALQRMRDAAERAKVELSTKQESEINIPYITADQTGPKHFVYKLTRAKLEQLVDELIERSFNSVKQALDDAKLRPDEIEEVILVGGQTRMPKIVERVREYFGRQPHKGVNPDEVVAMGAAIQGAVLAGDAQEVLLLDVTPLTLGIETLGGVRTPLIERNTTIPTSKNQIFSTAADNQTSVEINVLQGERDMAADNKSLGRFILDGIPPAPRGIPQIEVSFDIDSNGILNVSAKDKATSKEQKITIQGSTGLDKSEVEKMVQEAKEHVEEDKRRKEEVEARNIADSLCFTAEKTLKDAEGKIEADLKKEIEEKIKNLKSILKTASVDELKKKTEELSSALQKVSTAMYQQQQKAGPQKPPPDDEQKSGGEKKEDEVKEGEVVDE